MPNVTTIPAPRVPVIDMQTGLMSREWYRFFMNLYTLTSSGDNDTTLSDMLLAPLSEAVNMVPEPFPETQIVNYFVGDYSNQTTSIIYDLSEQINEIATKLATLPTLEVGEYVSKNYTGNVRIVGRLSVAPGSSVTPVNNGDVSFQLTSDTSLTFKAKGSDGTVRSGSITLT